MPGHNVNGFVSQWNIGLNRSQHVTPVFSGFIILAVIFV